MEGEDIPNEYLEHVRDVEEHLNTRYCQEKIFLSSNSKYLVSSLQEFRVIRRDFRFLQVGGASLPPLVFNLEKNEHEKLWFRREYLSWAKKLKNQVYKNGDSLCYLEYQPTAREESTLTSRIHANPFMDNGFKAMATRMIFSKSGGYTSGIRLGLCLLERENTLSKTRKGDAYNDINELEIFLRKYFK